MHPAKGAVFVEYKIYTVSKKTGKREKSFPFRNITSGQRTQLTIWVREGGLAYLALGTGYGRTNSRDDRRYLWLVPWREWLKLELKVRAHQDSLPLDFARQRPRTVAVREAGFDAVTQLKPFELVWEDGGWHLPPNHPLHVDEERDTKAFSAIWTRVRRYAEEENIEALLNEIKPD